MASTFNVHGASGYDQLMGRWSRKLAPNFIEFAGISEGERILDVGCGTGSLTFELAKHADLKEIQAIDFSPVFVAAAKSRNTDPRISIQQADATALPFDDGSFDRAMALLVLHFVPDASRAIAEMRRVVRPGGVVAAVVWDHMGGMTGMRIVVDTLAAFSEGGRQLRDKYVFQPMTQPGEMRKAFVEQCLEQVEQNELLLRMDYLNFADFWAPFAGGEGSIGKFVGALAPDNLGPMTAAVRDAYEAGRPDGPRSFTSVAWACRGVVNTR